METGVTNDIGDTRPDEAPVLRVCLSGVECTGKTTLAAKLARHYGTVWVPEFSRAYAASKAAQGSAAWERREFVRIALVQRRLEEAAEQRASQLVLLDTDPLTLWIWHRLYVEEPVLELAEIAETRPADLYLLLCPDIAWEADGVRSNQAHRHEMHELFIQELQARGMTYRLIEGDHQDRFVRSVTAIDGLIRANA